MGSTVMMYVLPMILGQTYDLGKDRPGVPIFLPSELENVTTKEQYFTTSQYRLVKNSDDIKDFLDISGKLALKVKAGMVDVSGEGSYLKESSMKTDGLEILIKFRFETVTKTIPSTRKPRQDWAQINKYYLGTHFCRSITYGGDLVAVIRISGSNSYDLEKIKGSTSGIFANEIKDLSPELKERLEKLKKSLQGISSMEINYYASVPIYGVSYTMDGLLKLVDDFPNHVKEVNNGLGNPLRMELYPLSSLDGGYPEYIENRALTGFLEDIEDQFDDLRATRKAVGVWLTSLPPAVPEGVQQKIDAFVTKINKIYGVYLQTIADLDVSKNASTQPLLDAVEAYKAEEYVIYQKYNRQFKKLQLEIYKEYPDLQPRIGGASYTHWGRNECDSPQTETVFSGVATASQTFSDGGSNDYICSPISPELQNASKYFSGYEPREEDEESILLLSPLRYNGVLKKIQNMRKKPIACARCRSYHRTTVLIKPGDIKCPSDRWTKEYDGLLMAPGISSPEGSYVCVDIHMQQPNGKITFGDEDVIYASDIQEVTIECGSLPCGPYVAEKPIPCVVCTI